MNKNTKKQPWGPFIKQVLGPNVPWAWYIINLVVSMATTNVSMLSYTYQGQIMAGEAIGNTAILWQYIGLNVLYLAIAMLTGISGSWANYWTERKLQNRLWGKMIRMPMRLYDKQDPSSLISRVTGDTMQVTYSLTYVFTLVNIAYSLVLMLGMIWEMNSATRTARSPGVLRPRPAGCPGSFR